MCGYYEKNGHAILTHIYTLIDIMKREEKTKNKNKKDGWKNCFSTLEDQRV